MVAQACYRAALPRMRGTCHKIRPCAKLALMLNAPSENASWRDSARFPLFFVVDARAVFPIVLCLLYIRLWTILLAIAATTFFGILNHYGFTVAVFGRWFRSFLAGRRKLAIPWWT